MSISPFTPATVCYFMPFVSFSRHSPLILLIVWLGWTRKCKNMLSLLPRIDHMGIWRKCFMISYDFTWNWSSKVTSMWRVHLNFVQFRDFIDFCLFLICSNIWSSFCFSSLTNRIRAIYNVFFMEFFLLGMGLWCLNLLELHVVNTFFI